MDQQGHVMSTLGNSDQRRSSTQAVWFTCLQEDITHLQYFASAAASRKAAHDGQGTSGPRTRLPCHQVAVGWTAAPCTNVPDAPPLTGLWSSLPGNCSGNHKRRAGPSHLLTVCLPC